jgi:hypothetical protein
MKPKYLLLALLLPSLLTGCSSDLLGTKPEPKPKKVVAKKAEKKHAAKPAKPTDNPTTTYAIDDGKNDFKVEAINPPGFQGQFTTPEPGQQPVMTAPIENNLQAQTVAPALNNAPVNTGIVQAPNHAAQAVNTLPPNANPPAALNSAASAAVQAVTPPSVPTPVAPALLGITVEDVVVPASASPAVFALSAQADASQKRGDLEGAVVITERALRIDSRNPIITYKLALLRLKQNKPQLAEDLAGKAALLAGSDLEMKRKSWLLIAEARQNQQNFQGAKDAKNKAESFFGR